MSCAQEGRSGGWGGGGRRLFKGRVLLDGAGAPGAGEGLGLILFSPLSPLCPYGDQTATPLFLKLFQLIFKDSDPPNGDLVNLCTKAN